jgi:hypothetical protein
VSALLFAISTLGFNIQPLLAVGGMLCGAPCAHAEPTLRTRRVLGLQAARPTTPQRTYHGVGTPPPLPMCTLTQHTRTQTAGASSIIIGLATQTLLTNAVMGVSIFLSRPFVPGDSITVQAPGAILVSGVVERVAPMRTLLRTDDGVLVTLPNKVGSYEHVAAGLRAVWCGVGRRRARAAAALHSAWHALVHTRAEALRRVKQSACPLLPCALICPCCHHAVSLLVSLTPPPPPRRLQT